ncbi:MAG: Nif3-like dinuclear metal center hexameric protein [Candidatus Pacebacteria bacterium]|nr:Nif3-like dinuclear metal center hexameric protein [Candidatus Paceibacterota bacterium]
MDIKEIKNILDDKFNINNAPLDLPFSRILPIAYNKIGINFRDYFMKDFLTSFHGLMIKNSEYANKVYLAVFLSKEILDKIFLRNENDILIFSHHPMDMESSNRGFLPLEEKYFWEMQRRRISVYILHTPLDIHKIISTSRSIAKALKLKDVHEYSKCSVGYAGIYGTLNNKVHLDNFINTLKNIFNINEVHYSQKFPSVSKIGIIAGGGAEVEYMKETIGLGCDTYLSGDYLNKVKTENSIRRRKEFEDIRDSLNINLIECSHYATERLVLINEMQDYFQELGLVAEFIDRTNYWK